ncbi:MAG: NADH-quinone oxidoreductase subunit NuoE [Nitrospirae bacterium]|nr:NADH-quinone oxidoreductase subunit NuoE [Nitrospirota bacterium]MBI3352351.1 NADH-quinone oxidoreductase subunit NuoE [Nitrospirota bacterium]
MISETSRNQIVEIMGHYPPEQKRSALLPALNIAQKENQGHLTEDLMKEVADILEITPLQVYEAATFYTMYNLKPIGKYHIQVCRTLPCALMGAEKLVSYLEEKLGVESGETTPDRLFTLAEVECLASCGTAPMMQINDDYYENLNKNKVDQILDDLRQKAK